MRQAQAGRDRSEEGRASEPYGCVQTASHTDSHGQRFVVALISKLSVTREC